MRWTAIALLAVSCGGLEDPGACIAIGYCSSFYTDVGQVEDALLAGAFVELCVADQCMTKVVEEYFGQRHAQFPELFGSVRSGPLQEGSSLATIVLELHGDPASLHSAPAEVPVAVTVTTFERAVVTTGSWAVKSETRIHPSGARCGQCRSLSP